MGTDSYVKSLRIKFEADDVSYKKIENDMNELSKLDLFSKDDAKAIADELKEFETLKNQIASIENTLDMISDVDNDIANKTRDNLEKELEKLKKQLNNKQRTKPEEQSRKDLQKEILSSISDGFSSFGDALSNTDNALGKTFSKFMSGTGDLFENASKLFSGNFDSLNDILTSALESLGSLLASGFDELENILNFSQLSDANTRDLMLRYGFSNSEAYGYTKAMNTLGFKSEEDLMYADQQELELFRKSFEKYSGKYNELYNSGMFDSMQEFNTQMEEFKEDVKLEVVDFFMNNQDTIRAAMKGIISLAEFAITALGKIVQWLNPDARTSDSQKAANTASIISNYSNINSGTNVSIDNTFNNVAKSDQTWLAHAGQLTYEQIIKALQ